MRVAVAVINHGLFLDALLGDRQVMRMTPSASGAVVSAAISSEFKRLARVAVGNFGQMAQRRFRRR